MESIDVEPLSCGLPALARSPDDGAAEKPPALPAPDLNLSSPASAVDAACPAAPSRRFTRSAVTDGGAAAQRQHQQRKARRCWSPELHRQFVDALQRLGGSQVATPKKIRKLMKVDGLTNDEVKSHLQKYRLHTWRAASSSDGGPGGDHHAHAAAAPEEQQEQYTAPEEQQEQEQHSTSQSGSPQGPLRLATVSSQAMSATAGDSCGGGDESESYSFGVTKASSSS